jgi:ubiquitin carboxyl-terminal hydrolase 8
MSSDKKGFCGLSNLGNTCFLNSCIQILSHTYELKYILKNVVNNTDNIIMNELNDLLILMWKHPVGTIISPNKFVNNMQKVAKIKNKELFTGWIQNDMTEFLLFIIDSIHNSISRSVEIQIFGEADCELDNLAINCYKMLKEVYIKEYSEIMDLFYGIYVSYIIDEYGKTLSTTPIPYFILDLPACDVDNIYDCFNIFTKSEYLYGENSWFNDKTNLKENINKKILFWNFPNILILTFNRFSSDGTQKIDNLIHFPLNNLDLNSYVCSYNKNQYIYNLYGVCNHYGGVYGGHYTSFVNNGKEWIHFNDESVEVISTTSIVTNNAYCLFYRKNIV